MTRTHVPAVRLGSSHDCSRASHLLVGAPLKGVRYAQLRASAHPTARPPARLPPGPVQQAGGAADAGLAGAQGGQRILCLLPPPFEAPRALPARVAPGLGARGTLPADLSRHGRRTRAGLQFGCTGSSSPPLTCARPTGHSRGCGVGARARRRGARHGAQGWAGELRFTPRAPLLSPHSPCSQRGALCAAPVRWA